MNQTDRFIENIFKLKESRLTEKIYDQAKKCLIDYIGVTLAGAHILKEDNTKDLSTLISEPGDSTIIGFDKTTTINNAAIINGISSHIIELDDGHRFGMMHPGGPIMTALLTVGERKNISGNKLLQGIIIGYEVAIRLASAIQPIHKKRGYHATGTCGAIGVAVGLAVALDYNKKETKNTLAAAITSAAGVLEMIDNISQLKPYNVGRAAANGISAAFIGKAGFSSPEDPIFGRRGFIAVLGGTYDKSCFEFNEKDKLLIETIYMKPYAACRHCHAPIEAVLKIKNRHNIDITEIEEINITTYDLAVVGHDHKEISSVNAAKMSIPYSVAAAIKFGKAGIGEFSQEHISNKTIKKIMQKINVDACEAFSKLVPQKRAAEVEIVTNRQRYLKRIDYPKGEPENPISVKELEEKIISLGLVAGKTKDEITRIISSVWHIEENIDKLFSLLK